MCKYLTPVLRFCLYESMVINYRSCFKMSSVCSYSSCDFEKELTSVNSEVNLLTLKGHMNREIVINT